ncbi:MAG: hypothetical protein IKO56_00500 [Alphaproteobacteria bacterium]|nr:hypothetical protein [Alphaproteobacteria bacterium]
MTPVFPWASYNPDDIPDLNPHNKDEMRGCLGVVVSLCIATALFVFLQYKILKLEPNIVLFGCLILLNVALYAALIIFLAKVSFKIIDWLQKRKNNKNLKN